MVHRLCRIVVVSLCLVSALSVVPAAFANTGSVPGLAPPQDSPLPIIRALEPPAEPSVAPSPALEMLPAPAPRRQTLPAPRPVIAQVSLLSSRYASSGPVLTYPAEAATSNAIRLMATRQVSTGYNRCAATVRQAMGFGLGDAHEWVRLSQRGFTRRPKGEPAQPGDIVVWPFTFGSRRSQHIGIAVGTSGGTKLLSNMEGTMKVTRMAPGYAAFYRKSVPAAPSLVAPTEPFVQLVRLPECRIELRAAIITAPNNMP